MWIDRSGGPGTKPVIRCGTNPQILEKAEETAQSAMTEGFVKRLKACAREDAKRGVYMSASSNLMRKEQMREQMAADEMIAYWVDSEVPEWDFQSVNDDTTFYVNEAGKLMIVFDEYEVAPGYMGSVEFEIPTEVVEGLVQDGFLK